MTRLTMLDEMADRFRMMQDVYSEDDYAIKILGHIWRVVFIEEYKRLRPPPPPPPPDFEVVDEP